MAVQIVTEDLMVIAHQKSKERAYWTEKMAGELADSRFPGDRLHAQRCEGEPFVAPFVIEGELYDRLQKLSNQSDLRLFMVLTAGLTLLLNKYTGLQDIVIGAPVNRQQGEADFINTVLVLRQALQEDLSFKQLLMKVRDTLAGAMEHQNFPLITLRDQLDHPLPDGRSYPFRTAILLEELHDAHYLDCAEPELVFSFRRGENRLEGEIQDRASRFQSSTVERLGSHFVALLQQGVKNPDAPHVSLDWIPEDEREELRRFNDTGSEYPRESTVVQLFDAQAFATPDRIAVAGEEMHYTYAQLQQQANRVATALRQKGIGQGQIVGFLLDRTPDAVVAMLGVLKAGAAYLPVSQKLPENRVQGILEDCNSPLLITKDVLRELLTVEAGELPDIDDPTSLAYVIFTSGSTGKPKGTMIEHRSVVNFIWGISKEVFGRYVAPSRVGLVSPFEFDAHVQNMLGALLNGHSLYVVPEEARVDGAKLRDFFRRHQVQISDGTPTHLRLLAEHLDENAGVVLQHVVIAGEALPPLLAKHFLSRFGSQRPILTNAYGPTETTVDSSLYHVHYDELDNLPSLPIGPPLMNQKAYIVGPRNQLQPIGVPGELCLTGDGLARGYLNRPELNAEKFPPNPFAEENTGMNEQRMYRTGDLARWLPDGNLDYLGRLDDQVKIRGLRIELGEIESRLLSSPNIREAVVLARRAGEGGDPYLCAYLVPETSLDLVEVRRALAQDLPDYMVPAYLIEIERLPITPNGKIDRKALPEPLWQQATAAYVAPNTSTERALVDIWSNLLGVEKIGVNDSFFELGGNSLQMTSVVAQIQRVLGVDVPLRELFQKPTIAELAPLLQGQEERTYHSIPNLARQDHYPVSSAQKRLYILNRFEGLGTTYNIPGVLLVDGPLDVDRLEKAVRQLVERHEALRTSFQFIDCQPVQIVHEEVELAVKHLHAASDVDVQPLIQSFIRPFDLKQAPLMRIGLISLHGDATRHWLLFDLHHIIADGVSLALLEREWIALYQGEELRPLSLQYKDYAAWQRNRSKSGEMQEQGQFWQEYLSGELPILQLPTDRPRPLNQSFAGDRFQMKLPAHLSQRLQLFADGQGVTPYMVLLATYNVLLHRYTQQEDIIVGTPIAGRVHSDLDPMIGMFVNTLAMRNRPQAHRTFTDFLAEVKSSSINAFQNQEVPFEEVVDQLHLQRDTSRNALFDTMLVMQNNTRTTVAADELTFTPYPFAHQASKVDLTLEFHQEEKGLLMAVEYATQLFEKATMQRFAAHFLTLLESAMANPNQELKDIALLPDEERNTVLRTFNDTQTNLLHKGLLHELLETQSAQTPDRIAVIAEGVGYTYAEINARANQIARRLRELGIGRGERVGLLLTRSVELVVAVYAVLKAGGAYVPIDPEYPEDRVGYLLKDSAALVLLTETAYLEKTTFAGAVVDLKQPELYQGDSVDLDLLTTPNDLAYILYTSGSTGKPKGVMVQHASIVNYLYAMQAQYPMTAEDAFLLKTPYTFDVSVNELYGWTLTGGRLVVLEEGGHRSPKAILRAVIDHQIRLLNFVPSMFKVFLNAVGDEVSVLNILRYLLLAGEALPKELVEQFERLGSTAQLHNLYGPTEATVITTTFPLEHRKAYHNIPIGKPLPNVRVYILDPHMHPTPIGVVGELYIAGAGLASGYLNNESLTAEKFVDDPFVTGERMYRTGDLVRWLSDGHVEFLGRIDHQVKIRGYRIELGEVESILLAQPAINEAVVVDRDDALGNKQLVAYYVSKTDLDLHEIKAHLGRFLPSFMVPSLFCRLEAMPLTTSGKIDRNALPVVTPAVEEERVEHAGPRTDVERKLVDLWTQLLGVNAIGIDDDFFELGGNSLLAVELDLALEEADVRADDLVVYEHRSIRALAAHIEELRIATDEA
ncbi:amino acid adenylation domain-containing protein [Tumebacillus sp. ITR2]|uniref:Amino acid adenylation domain-containing protein n=1 Tax=Tumebacillus amylolyticus TaxID=2801339 RepID=A0ABS1JEE9_9BACL|nr:non-ribosomal peptide synthetase [Tumebacillus amylolyticus]MBL0388660.1 amino acid adenylation domain-containing protein [Tumebacillus amylolyticus]